MKRFIILALILGSLVGLNFLGGCSVYEVAVEERSTGEWVDDQQISFTIEQSFLEDSQIKFLDFDAYSYQGHVYLIGEYESREQVNRAVYIAKNVQGVRKVTTYFLPKRSDDTCGTTDNVELNAKVRQKLIADKNIWSTNVDIEMLQCKVILLGIVATQQEKEAAESHARSVSGVREVKSYITVKP